MTIFSSQTDASKTKPSTLTFSIITPHHGKADANDPLFCCVASVADQENIRLEQIVQHTDGVSGLWNKLSRDLNLSKKTAHYTLRILEEKNSSFYDLLHRGLQRAQGTFFGCLQPEEQYLPGALAAVEKEFQTHPELDVVMTSCLVVDPKTNQPIPHHTSSFSPEYLVTCAPKIFPCTLFFRATLLAEGFSFDAFVGSNQRGQHEEIFNFNCSILFCINSNQLCQCRKCLEILELLAAQ